MNTQQEREQQAIDSLNFSLQAVNAYLNSKYKVIVFDKACVKCRSWCEFKSWDFKGMDSERDADEDLRLTDSENSLIKYERQADKPILYKTAGGKCRLSVRYLVESKLNFNDAGLIHRHKEKLKQELKEAGVKVNNVNLMGIICPRGRSLRISLVITY